MEDSHEEGCRRPRWWLLFVSVKRQAATTRKADAGRCRGSVAAAAGSVEAAGSVAVAAGSVAVAAGSVEAAGSAAVAAGSVAVVAVSVAVAAREDDGGKGGVGGGARVLRRREIVAGLRKIFDPI
uniref:Uncharacterized protein n=1 Tax=Oryza sativa subsp. japonica TaxID=39947 RepID=Q6K369_ORYSJ|nr:hypothetical protein [Oryza sativa Japonica Group]BAD22449.1 hypothetical protein [Oryza sativa Japonica Group]